VGVDVIAQILTFSFENPAVLMVVGGIVFVLFIASKRRGPRYTNDSRRAFTPAQRLAATRHSGGRCEHSAFTFRCRRPGEHADHIVPWSRGGATEMSNLQWLCSMHNLRKSNLMPSGFYIARLVSRRRRYFPAGVDASVEWRLGVAR
jgi:5-methylcytosine-specific restriction endonuclease McrA